MKATFKNKLLLKFDEAIKDAEEHGMEIHHFSLESPQELRNLKYWTMKQGGLFAYDNMEYEGVLIEIPTWLRVQDELTD